MKTIGRLLLLIIVLGALGALVVYRAPLWTRMQWTHFGLFLSRIQSNYVMTPEGRVHYYEAEPRMPGGGIPIVLVHGLGDRGEAWAPMLKRLKRAGFHVYAPDLLGYGRSPKPEDSDYSIDTQEKFIVDFIKSLGLQKTNIGGWSMGGWIALQAGLHQPDLIDRVVVYDNAGITFVAPDRKLFHPTSQADVENLFTTMEPGMQLAPNISRDILKTMQSNQWVVDRGVDSMMTGKSLLDKDLANLKRPLLIVWGKDDHLIPVSVGQAMHEKLPTSELDILEGCGHLAPESCSARTAAASADFLKANPVPPGSVRTLAHMH